MRSFIFFTRSFKMEWYFLFTLLLITPCISMAPAQSENNIESEIEKIAKELNSIESDIKAATARQNKRTDGAKELAKHKRVVKGGVTPHVTANVCKGNKTCINLARDVLQAFQANRGIKTAFTTFEKKLPRDVIKNIDNQLESVISDSEDGNLANHKLTMPGKESWEINVETIKGLPSAPYKLSSLKIKDVYNLEWDGDVLTASFTMSPPQNVDLIVKASE